MHVTNIKYFYLFSVLTISGRSTIPYLPIPTSFPQCLRRGPVVKKKGWFTLWHKHKHKHNIKKVRKTCVNRGYISISTSISTSISISIRKGTFSIFLCLCLCLCLRLCNPGSQMFFLLFLCLCLCLCLCQSVNQP